MVVVPVELPPSLLFFPSLAVGYFPPVELPPSPWVLSLHCCARRAAVELPPSLLFFPSIVVPIELPPSLYAVDNMDANASQDNPQPDKQSSDSISSVRGKTDPA
ncbi:hypothetical protein RJT34_27428 [Clitoria ternatea]|uniref:Uncharacterized protein n=1 Tax=Clitoria ternatea TaxID=43366 RepID=A0AAN9IGB5_CLITE